MCATLTNFGDHIEFYTSENTKNWRKLLKFAKILDLKQRRTFLWAWPTEEDLQALQMTLEELNITHLLSVGCGNGLFEWILKESIGVQVFGVEVDRTWWQSKYSTKNFIELNYVDELTAQHKTEPAYSYLQQCCHTADWNFALLFCYFNNRAAFLSYLEMYKGNCVILVGPKPGMDVHSDPQPLEPQFPAGAQWQLSRTLNIGDNDVMAIYKRLT